MPNNPGKTAMMDNARGSSYAREISQRPAPSIRRGIANTGPITSGRMGGSPNPENMMPDYAGRRPAYEYGGLSGGQDMQLRQQGYIDIGNVRYILDPQGSGRVFQVPLNDETTLSSASATGNQNPYAPYGAPNPVPLMEAIRRGR